VTPAIPTAVKIRQPIASPNMTGERAPAVAELQDSQGVSTNITDEAAWSSSDPSVAVVTRGVAQFLRPGIARIFAAYGGATGSVTTIVVGAPLQSIALGPASPFAKEGATVPLSVTGTFDDGSMRDVSSGVVWTSSDPLVAMVVGDGGKSPAAQTRITGTTTLSAAFGNLSTSTVLTVTR
jgi:hypothetical protein